MSGLKSGAVLLLLAIPFGLYVAWQLQAATRADFAASDPPPDKAPDTEKLAKAKAKAEKWAGDVRRSTAVALQYRPAGPEDAAEDADCIAVTRAVGTRSADLTDLEKFLSGVDRPTYTGSLKANYTEWQTSKEKLRKAEEVVEAWLRNPLAGAVDGQASAIQALKGFEELVSDYRKDSKFADSSRAAAWQVEARVKVIEALEESARKPYDEVLVLPLPLPNPKDSKLVERAVGAPAAIREQVKLLQDDIARVEETKRVLPDRVTKAANGAIRRADEWAAKEQLLSLFADPELFTDPNKATDWLTKVQSQFNKTQSDGGRELIRKKVQQFCEAYIPKAARLDAKVLIQGKEEPRSGVAVEYDSDAKTKALTDHPQRLNEFNYLEMYKNPDRITWAMGNRFAGVRGTLKPTPTSIVARDFTEARANVGTWSLSAVNQLKKKCEGADEAVQQERRNALDSLVGAEGVKDLHAKEPFSSWTRENTKIWTRLSALSTAMTKHPGLFETGP